MQQRYRSAYREGVAVLVVGHDGHAACDSALARAIELAVRLDAEVHVLHCVTLDDYGLDPDGAGFERAGELHVAAVRERVESALADSPVVWSYREAHGEAAEQLAQLAAELDALMIVVGATQRHLLSHLTGGGDDVSKRLLHHQRRPVLVVPG
jgi:nucleotide-binding universal stress UspA family protein